MLLTTKELADRLSISVRTIEGWSRLKVPPPSSLTVRGGVGLKTYDPKEMEKWISSHLRLTGNVGSKATSAAPSQSGAGECET